ISEGAIYHINPDTCIECGTCESVCPTGAILPPQ
ncbi:MAG: 4Fe-4S binding protein, partial [Muribaculaceae bacterium]|nr:4Fe-4S binding protein [Muribaculaceae bacterium]